MDWWRRPYLWAGLSAVGVFVANIGGVATGDDGVAYVAIAERLLDGRGLGYFLEDPLTVWPPGWPALIALVAWATPLGTQGAAIALNMVAVASVVLLVHRILRHVVASQQLVFIGTVTSALGAEAMLFGHLLLTDYAFAGVTLGLFLAMLNYRNDPSPRWLIAAAAIVWAGFMLRYAGIVHIGTVGLWLLLDQRFEAKQRMMRAAGFGAMAAVVPVAWVLRNLATDGTTLGERYPSNRGFLHNVHDTILTIGNFIAPGLATDMETVWLGVAAVGVAVVAALLWRALRAGPDAGTRVSGVMRLVGTGVGLFVLHVIVYAVYMIYVRSTAGLNRLDIRLLFPLYIPLVIVALAIIDRVEQRERVGSPWRTLARGTVSLWAVCNVLLGVVMIGYFSTNPRLFGGNYNADEFVAVRESPIIAATEERCDPDRIVSNLPSGFFGSGVEPAWMPRRTFFESNVAVDDLKELNDELRREGDLCLLYVDLAPTYGHLATLDDLEQRVEVTELVVDEPVVLYRLSAR